MSAKIEQDQELDKVKFGNAIDYYNDIIGVTAQFEVTKPDIELIKIMAKNSRALCIQILSCSIWLAQPKTLRQSVRPLARFNDL